MDIKNVFGKLIELYQLFIKLITNPFLMVSVCVTCGILIFIPETYVNLYKAIQENLQLIFLSFVISSFSLFAMLLRYCYFRIHLYRYLKHLSLSEKEVLRQFINQKEKILFFSMLNQGILSLYENLIVTMGSIGGLTHGRINQSTFEDERPFSLDNRAVKILNKNKELLK